jgi:hypothetical protein
MTSGLLGLIAKLSSKGWGDTVPPKIDLPPALHKSVVLHITGTIWQVMRRDLHSYRRLGCRGRK